MRPDLNNEIKRALMAEPATPELPTDEEFFNKLHDKIMAAVEKTEIKPVSPWEKPKRLLRANWKSWVVSGGSLMMVLMASLQAPSVVRHFMNDSHTVQLVRNEDEFAHETLKSPDEFSGTLISYQNQDDFLVDVAERTFHDLSQEHVREIMGEAGL